MRLVFAGTPEFAKTILLKLLQHSDIEIICVLTQPDRQAGRGQKLSISAVKELAVAHNIEVLQPESLKDPSSLAFEKLKALNIDLMVVAAYGLILPQHVLDLPKYGCINAHASILPKWRGASPIQHSILSGDVTTGITVMQMEKGLDSGPMLKHEEVNILPADTAQTLHDKLATLAAKITCEVVEEIKISPIDGQIQDHTQATYAHKIVKSDARINWGKTTIEIERAIRAYNPWPIAYTEVSGKVIRVFVALALQTNTKTSSPPGTIIAISKDGIQVATKDGIINITKLQLPGKKPVNISDFYNALPKDFIVGACCE